METPYAGQLAEADECTFRLMPMGDIAPTTLEEAARDLLVRIPRLSRTMELFGVPQFNDQQALVLLRRRGWDGRTAGTLQEAGDLVGITRERVRQLDGQLERWVALVTRHDDRDLPSVLLQALQNGLRSTSDRALAATLESAGLASGEWSFGSLASLLHLCGRHDLDRVISRITVADQRLAKLQGLAPPAVWEASRKLGFAHVDAIRVLLRRRFADSERNGAALLDDEIDHALRSCSGVMTLPYGYYYCAPHRDPTVVETARRMLMIHEPLNIREIRDGLRRRCKFRRIPFRVPLDALRVFFRDSPDFDLDESDLVRPVNRPAASGDTLQRWIVEQIRDSDYGLLTRNQIMSRARRARKNTNSVSIYLTYGEQIVHDKRGFYYPVGCPPDEDVVVPALDVAGAMARPTLQRWYFDSEQDVVTVLLELGDTALSSGVVITEPSWRSYLDLLGDHHYQLVDEEGTAYGSIYRSEPMCAIAGLSTLIAHSYPEPGDMLKLEIDRRARSARAEVGGSELDSAAQ